MRVNDALDYLLAACASTFVLIGIELAYGFTPHWLLVPVFFCGVLMGADAVALFRGRLDLFDPIAIVGVYGYHFFFIAPLLTIGWDYSSRAFTRPLYWDFWIGAMAGLNLCGILIYRLTRSMSQVHLGRTTWQFNRTRTIAVFAVMIPLASAAQLYVFASLGGIRGMIDLYSDRRRDAFEGLGWQFLIAESFPILVAVAFFVWKREWLRNQSWAKLVLLAFLFFGVKLLFGGLRGSRSNTVWALVWLAAAFHYYVKRIPVRLVVLGVFLVAAFMYVYGFYKALGVSAYSAVRTYGFSDLSERTGRTQDSLLLGDFARTDVQAYLLYRLTEIAEYDYGFGSTYARSLLIVLPKGIRPSFFGDKVEKGTEAFRGRGAGALAHNGGETLVYGLAGEAMLNFGILAAPLAFAALGYAVRWSRSLLSQLLPDDARHLLLPYLSIGCVVLLTSDSDNLVVFFIRTSAMALAAIVFACDGVIRKLRDRLL